MLVAALVVVVLDAAVVSVLVLAAVPPLPLVGVLVAFVAAQLLVGPTCALAAVRARRLPASEEPQLHEALERLCQLADMRSRRSRSARPRHRWPSPSDAASDTPPSASRAT